LETEYNAILAEAQEIARLATGITYWATAPFVMVLEKRPMDMAQTQRMKLARHVKVQEKDTALFATIPEESTIIPANAVSVKEEDISIDGIAAHS